MKKVLFVTESLNIGGMEKELVILANELVRYGYDVKIILYGENSSNNLIEELDEDIELVLKERKPLTFRRKLPYFHRYYRNDKWEKRASAKSLYKYYVGKDKFDIEIGFFRGPSIKIISGSTNRKSKKFAWVHTDFKLCDPKSITKFFSNMDEVKVSYGKFDKIVTVSQKAGESFVDIIGWSSKCQTIYNMIDLNEIVTKSKIPITISKEKLTFITVGRFVEAKGYLRLLNVVDRLNREGYLFDMWFIGYGRDESELREHVEKNKINNVKFWGYQKNPYKYMSKADVFVCSSIREGFSLVTVEAMACGLPVVSTSCTGPTEILENGKYGILVDNNERGLYEGLKSILDNQKQICELSVKSKERAKHFDKRRVLKEVIDLLEGE